MIGLAVLAGLSRAPLWGCACGCGVFDVQTSALLPTGPGGTAFLEYDSMDQNQNWSGSSRTSAGGMGDKRLRTLMMTAGAQHMFNRRWGFSVQAPLWNRYLQSTDENGALASTDRTALGDVRLRGIYSGFSEDMSSGLTVGAKLPTGDYRSPGFDRDSEIGSGSADLLLGAYRMGALSADGAWAWFANLSWDQPVLAAAGYRPGAEADAVAGAYYGGWRLGEVKVVPLAQAIGAVRLRDSGTAADPADSGYRRAVLGPGLELDTDRWLLVGAIGFPVAQSVNGEQLVAPRYFKLRLGYRL